MNDLRDKLIQAHRDNRFLDAVDAVYDLSIQDRDVLTAVLVNLHNTSVIDIVAAFSALRNVPGSINFFLTRHVLESVLPELNADVLSVMKCVIQLTKEAGQDLAAGTLIEPYIEFCSKVPSRSDEAMKLIQKDTHGLMDLLSPTLVAGAREKVALYVQKAIELANHADLEVRKRAIFSLGRIQYQTKTELANKAIDFIAKTAKQENDDHLLGNAVGAAFDIYRQNPSTAGQVVSIFNEALEKGSGITLHTASAVFGFHTDEIRSPLLDMLLKYLVNVQPGYQRTIDNIDLGLNRLLATKNNQDTAIAFLEQLLLTNEGIEMDKFDSTTFLLAENENGLLNRLMTRWLLGGEHTLCRVIDQIIKSAHNNDVLLTVDPDELANPDSVHLIFLARKTIGYLFLRPAIATRILLSLLPFAKDRQTTSVITQLIFDPLLLNYPGEVGNYLKEQSNTDNAMIKAASQQAIQAFEKYTEDIGDVRNLSEHRPPMTNRETFRRHYSRQMQQMMREVEKQSVIMQIAKKSTLLYGTKSITYIGEPFTQNRRVETSLQKYSSSMEIPRLSNIDPVGLDYILRIFRHEQIRA